LSVGVLSFAESPFLPSLPSLELTGFARSTAGCAGALVKDDSVESGFSSFGSATASESLVASSTTSSVDSSISYSTDSLPFLGP